MVDYLTKAQLRTRTIMPYETFDALDERRPGYIENSISERSAAIEAKLIKRYAIPHVAPFPLKITQWVNWMCTVDLYLAAGFDPSSEQDKLIAEREAKALEELEAAADAEKGLFELPLRADTSASGVSKGEPLGSSDPDAFAWMDAQREAVRGV